MFSDQVCSVRLHDLLEVDPERFIATEGRGKSIPGWVEERLLAFPFVVVRRGMATERKIPVGVRGETRNQRWAASCHRACVKKIITPPQLLQCAVSESRAQAIPALRSLFLLKVRWRDFDLPWGPGGSIAFELATGRQVANPKSDLDIVVYADNRLTKNEAKRLCAVTADLPSEIDIRVETPRCGFSLREYSSANSNILLRTPTGGMLGRDPWQHDLRIANANQVVKSERGQR
ncbi:MAG TPA: malonate decarboxylase holo-ACP synthase [Candidatus Limnocylindrales bacterium]|jgi:phosphoribosyl-dephospho-CoA transferase|nr:malonate decarboxylase holo-ACP synthase [Candidatus Limnocylindrales bacterium]